jgi:hypothetical protein
MEFTIDADDRIGRTITLNEIEQKICQGIANKRYENNRNKGVQDRKIGKQSNAETDLEGIASEMSFCKIFNVFPDLSVEVRSVTADAGDAVLHSGQSVDVKATKYPTGKLIAVPWKEKNSKVSLYALMVGQFPTYTFKGFMRKEELLRAERLGSLGYDECFIAKQHELRTLEDVLG